MLSKSGIDYLPHVWNVAVGCNGTCSYCWARNRWAPRQVRHCPRCAEYMPHIHGARFSDVTPRQKPKRIGVGFFADLFGPWQWLWGSGVSQETWDTKSLVSVVRNQVAHCPQHQFFTLTRHPENIPQRTQWPENWWIGVTVTTQEEADRLIPALLASGVRHPWLSYEPARGPVRLCDCTCVQGESCDCPCHRIQWVVAGGQTGKDAEPSHPDWFRRVRDDCVAAGVPFYFKSWGKYIPAPFDSSWEDGDMRVEPNGHSGPWTDDYCVGDAKMRRVGKKAAGHLLDGSEWRQMPEGCDGE